MSGGVDSSVAAHLLKRDGHEVIGLFMRTGAHAESADRRAKTCCSVADALDARAVADRLDIPFFALDFQDDFDRIQDYFADEYLAGRTPNPCVLCNVWLKFGKLWAYGKQVGADLVATGHYARRVRDAAGRPRIARAVDRSKDQSYVLAALRPEVLERMLLPVGGYPKAEIRAQARALGLPVHDKPDSQEICFVPDDDYRAVVRARRPDAETSGTIVDETGRVLRAHDGLEAFTVGQRRGLGVALGAPRYVVQIDAPTRTVRLGPRADLDRPGLEAERFVWHVEVPSGPLPCLAQIRAQHRAAAASAWALDGGRVRVRFATSQPAIAPGQLVALYDGETLLGGGWIARALEEGDCVENTVAAGSIGIVKTGDRT
jgi:tRNA-specific 2-thiouridylase